MSLAPADDMEYRLDLIDPYELESGGMQLSDMAEYHMRLNEMGRKKTVKKELFAEMIESFDPDDVYVYFRLLTNRFAHPDRALGIGETMLAEAVGQAFYGGNTDAAMTAYEDYSDSFTRAIREDGLGDGVEDWTAVELYKRLLEIEQASAESELVDLMADALERTTEPWVVCRAFKSDEAYYAGEYMFVDAVAMVDVAFSKDELRRAWGIQNDGPLVFLDWAWDDRSVSTEIEPHTMIGEMKAKKVDSTKAAELAGDGNRIAQTKYDGARVFIHHAGDGDYRAYMAGNSDVTAQLPELFEAPLSSQLPEFPFIIDGEVTPYDPETGEVLPFQHILKRTGRDPDEMVAAGTGGVEARFKFFDVLRWQGHDVSRYPYEERFEMLRAAFTPDLVARTGTDLDAVYQASIEEGHEGVVIKTLDHEFDFNTRSSDWYKWKADPMEADLRVSGVKEGSGRASDGVGALALQARYDHGWVDVGSVGTGFSDHDRERLLSQHEAGELVGKTVQVSFEELQVSSEGSSVALRFPSFQSLRPEGSPDSLERLARIGGVEDVVTF